MIGYTKMQPLCFLLRNRTDLCRDSGQFCVMIRYGTSRMVFSCSGILHFWAAGYFVQMSVYSSIPLFGRGLLSAMPCPQAPKEGVASDPSIPLGQASRPLWQAFGSLVQNSKPDPWARPIVSSPLPCCL